MFNITKLNYSVIALMIAANAFAGNEDRAGSAGATELLINPWARSSGWGGNTAAVRGIEAQFFNIAGTAFTKKTEIGFTHTKWLKGTDININAVGISQKVGESGALSLGIMSMDFGEIPITTAENPEGGLGTFSPQLINISLGYAKAFSNSIYGGLNLKVISESVSDARAQGVAIDAGIQYLTGFNEAKDNLKFGIAMKNVGNPMRFSGDGLTQKTTTEFGTNLTTANRAERFEMPSLINIGAAYDFKLKDIHRITFAAMFTSNSFTNDQTTAGIEYGFKKLFMIRAGYTFEKNGTNSEETTNGLTGLAAGLTVELPIGKSGKMLGIDYSYRDSDPWDGTHSFGLLFKL